MQSANPIDMFTPARTCQELGVDEATLLDMVNQGHLPAYNIGGEIRFKIVDIASLIAMLTLA